MRFRFAFLGDYVQSGCSANNQCSLSSTGMGFLGFELWRAATPGAVDQAVSSHAPRTAVDR